jgi:protein-S-isoprenylcysteine O-methyltransferase Ste14
MKENENKFSEGIGWKAIIRFVMYLLLMPMVLFIAAGTLHWTMGWIYVILSIAFTGISRIIVFRKNPEMLKERARSMEAENVKNWDRAILLFGAILGPLVLFMVAGLDVRFSWSPHIPILIQSLALIGVVLGYVLGGWAMVVNKFFSAVARTQKEQSQTVISNGPYKFVRHPGYAGGILTLLSTPMMLGSLWALLPAGFVISLTIVRTFLEDTMLQEELDGYKEYSHVVKFRLLPGVW